MLDRNAILEEMTRRFPDLHVEAGYVRRNGKEEAWVRLTDSASGRSETYEVTRDNYVGDMKVISEQRVRSDLREETA